MAKKKKKKNIFQWGNPSEQLSAFVEGVDIYKINLKKNTYFKRFMQRIIQKRILNVLNAPVCITSKKYVQTSVI